MKIAIIGAGNVGGALAKGWAKAGHTVILGARDPQKDKIRSLVAFSKNISATSLAEAADEAEVILIALSIGSVVEVIKKTTASVQQDAEDNEDTENNGFQEDAEAEKSGE